jgi:hypothetical protein
MRQASQPKSQEWQKSQSLMTPWHHVSARHNNAPASANDGGGPMGFDFAAVTSGQA